MHTPHMPWPDTPVSPLYLPISTLYLQVEHLKLLALARGAPRGAAASLLALLDRGRPGGGDGGGGGGGGVAISSQLVALEALGTHA